MSRDELLSLLRDHRSELYARGAKTLAVFGSFARDEATADSDVDILVEFETAPTLSGYMGLKFYLEELIGRSVDLVPRRTLKARIKPYVEREAIYVA